MKKKPLRTKKVAFLLMQLCFFLISCEDFLDIDAPRNELTNEKVFELEEAADASVNGIYSSLRGSFSFINAAHNVYSGILSDEMQSFSTLEDFIQFSSNQIEPFEPNLLQILWRSPYRTINSANNAIEGLETSTELSQRLKDRLLGEALFLRAFMHFYLVNYFGNIPYIESTDFNTTTNASRQSADEVYSKIIDDLERSRTLLPQDFSFVEGNERIRVNRDAASCLLARVYLYTNDWTRAIEASSQVIENPLYVIEENPEHVFLASSPEAIWQLQPDIRVRNFNDTNLGTVFIIQHFPPGTISSNSAPQVSLSNSLVNVFDTADFRLANWVGDFSGFKYCFKYQNNPGHARRDQEYTVLMRLAELYLIRAEALAQEGSLSLAINDLDVIRKRARVPLLSETNPSISQMDLLETIYREREFELFGEGHRWFDLKRTNRADAVLAPLKEDWQSTDVLLPIPEDELLTNPNLAPQNQGY